MVLPVVMVVVAWVAQRPAFSAPVCMRSLTNHVPGRPCGSVVSQGGRRPHESCSRKAVWEHDFVGRLGAPLGPCVGLGASWDFLRVLLGHHGASRENHVPGRPSGNMISRDVWEASWGGLGEGREEGGMPGIPTP